MFKPHLGHCDLILTTLYGISNEAMRVMPFDNLLVGLQVRLTTKSRD
jgi:hypothetical protein